LLISGNIKQIYKKSGIRLAGTGQYLISNFYHELIKSAGKPKFV